ncbi:hypothetical protein CLV91_1129 [Maribacter vaceletii]|uniref:Outer membrane protein with beta-barrel domain n=1 Tax=Maribacter vaceletii TaxID=1206816 RepID=A0A495EGI7_9FLAO|nr:hypothetical protein [Maribacter vaceletii]RKR15047.1 hypothetical protein CLV91_1129 [Maribacter vaceletii]
MTKPFLTILFILSIPLSNYAQEEIVLQYYNQFSSNISYATLGSLDINYERTISKYITAGVGVTSYSNSHNDLNLEKYDGYSDYKVNLEINPFVRLYVHNTQKKSLFIEVLGSYNEAEVNTGRRISRTVNNLGYGVYAYDYGAQKMENIGLGTGVGYRFLLLKNRLVLEAQFGVRTNLKEIWIYDIGLVRTGIKAGYRF